MTTPERLRRRQRIEGTFVIVLAVLMILGGLYFNAEDAAQRACINDSFRELSRVQGIRADLIERESNANQRVNLAEFKVSTEAEFLAEGARYERVMNKIQAERERNPVPPYPAGECE